MLEYWIIETGNSKLETGFSPHHSNIPIFHHSSVNNKEIINE